MAIYLMFMKRRMMQTPMIVLQLVAPLENKLKSVSEKMTDHLSIKITQPSTTLLKHTIYPVYNVLTENILPFIVPEMMNGK